MAVFVEANPPEILRASQKDESYINTIKSDLADIVQRLFGKQHNFLVFWSQSNGEYDLVIVYSSLLLLYK